MHSYVYRICIVKFKMPSTNVSICISFLHFILENIYPAICISNFGSSLKILHSPISFCCNFSPIHLLLYALR